VTSRSSDEPVRPSRSRGLLALACALLVGGCGTSMRRSADGGFSAAEYVASSRRSAPGPRFRPPPSGLLVGNAAPVDGMRCRAGYAVVSVAHVELFAANRVVVLPAGIGVAPPLSRHGAYVPGGRCVYPLHTVEPTGVVLIGPGRGHTLGELFALWGQRLSRNGVAGFRAGAEQRVSVFLDGVRWRGNPAVVPLAQDAQITIEVGPYVPPHPHYVFPPLAAIDLHSVESGVGRESTGAGAAAGTAADARPSRSAGAS
jgi:hypothetical protein